MPSIYEALSGVSLSEAKTALVDLGGAGNIVKSMSVLSSMGIATKAVVDLDFAFKDAVSSGLVDASSPAITGCKEVFRRLEHEGSAILNDASLPMRNGSDPASVAYRRMAAQEDAIPLVAELHRSLKEHGIWIWTHGAIEAHLELESKKSSAHAQFSRNMRRDGFLESLPNFDAVRGFVDWI